MGKKLSRLSSTASRHLIFSLGWFHFSLPLNPFRMGVNSANSGNRVSDRSAWRWHCPLGGGNPVCSRASPPRHRPPPTYWWCPRQLTPGQVCARVAPSKFGRWGANYVQLTLVYTQMWMFIHIYIYAYIYMCVCVSIYIYNNVYIYMHIYIYHIYIYHIYIWYIYMIYIYMIYIYDIYIYDICLYIYISYIYIYIMYIYIYIMYIYIYHVYIYIYTICWTVKWTSSVQPSDLRSQPPKQNKEKKTRLKTKRVVVDICPSFIRLHFSQVFTILHQECCRRRWRSRLIAHAPLLCQSWSEEYSDDGTHPWQMKVIWGENHSMRGMRLGWFIMVWFIRVYDVHNC